MDNLKATILTQATLRSFAAHLWAKGGKTFIKKILLSSAYAEVTENNFDDLSTESTLMLAMI